MMCQGYRILGHKAGMAHLDGHHEDEGAESHQGSYA